MKKQLTFFAIAIAAITSAQANEETYMPPAESSSLTRAEVNKDLIAWHDSGLAALSSGESTPDIYSRNYRASIAIYQQRLQELGAGNRTAAK